LPPRDGKDRSTVVVPFVRLDFLQLGQRFIWVLLEYGHDEEAVLDDHRDHQLIAR
jgi:hypothetical protein